MSLVSIVLPYYKKENYIKKTIDSIISQTYQELEIIIVDDEQSFESKKILNDLKILDKRIVLIKNNKNLGAGYSRNEAIKISNGKYIAFCDADDLWNKSKIEKQLKFMESSNVGFSYTSYNIIDEFENIIGKRTAKSQISFNDLIKSCDIGLSTVIIEKKIIDTFKIYFPNTKTKEDYIFWLRLSKNGVEMLGLDENLSNWRKLESSLSSSVIQRIFDGYKVYRQYLKFSVIKSLIYLIVLSINRLLKDK
jgi:teichuronic acid biosynthesis glycosyltransferase TuaG|tara:strand:- start:192 stop:941 length:750 start_codon:yes stop_codon:yes gene_type:complete